MLPVIEAHRGDSTNAPENTLAAFRAAVDLQVLWIELDIHPTRDGALVVIHDDRVDRTTNGSGAVSGLTLDEMARLDAGSWFGVQFAGEPVPQLADVLALVAPTDTRLNIEIKAAPPGLDVARALVDLLRAYDKERAYVVSSFDLPALLKVQAIAPEITLALIGNGPDILPPTQDHGLAWIHGYHKTVDAAIVAEAHAAGKRVNVWTVDDPATLASWAAMAVDKLCTNCPAAMLAAAER
ncbi:MAG: glycerophosphodiester phosphodiesterase [Anaerolineae bacterium]|nr:glycerophosphodiester phosphodiesterase [Anaerolineae bacterium]